MVLGGYAKEMEKDNLLALLFRAIAIPIVYIAEKISISPNFITSLSIFVGLLSVYFFSERLYGVFLLLWTVSIVFDYADGTLARRTGKASYFGYLLDMLGDRLKLISLILMWAYMDDTIAVRLTALMIIISMVLIEIVTHVFVAPAGLKLKNKICSTGAFQLFVSYDMHSFFIFGIFLSVGDGWSLTGAIWLLFILQVCLFHECDARRICREVSRDSINPKILRFIENFRR